MLKNSLFIIRIVLIFPNKSTMKKLSVGIILGLCICHSSLSLRVIRDNGAAFEDSGGPVAAGSKDQMPAGHHPRPKSNGNSQALPCRYGAKHGNRIRRSLVKPFGPQKPLWTPKPFSLTTKSTASSSEDHDKSYSNFLEKFKAKNPNLGTEQKQNFAKNLDVINNLNTARKALHAASFGITKYSDLTFDQFWSKLGGTKEYCGRAKKVKATNHMKMVAKICSKLDWNDHNVIPEVHQQDQCGSCYALSTSDLISSVNSVENKNSKIPITLSAQYIIDCLTDPAAQGCIGGRPKEVIVQLSRSSGQLPLEKCYPYKDVQQKSCPNINICPEAPNISLQFSEVVDGTGDDEMAIMASMLQRGPVVAIVGLSQAWQFYDGQGIITEEQCDEMGNHAVLVTGYDYSNKEAPYYIVKNSWGADWGQKGYVKIEAGKNVCDIARNALVLCTKHCDANTDVQNLLEESNNPECRVRHNAILKGVN